MAKTLNKIEGLMLSESSNLHIRADGPEGALNEVKKRLTIKDKSAYFKQKRIEKSLMFLGVRIKREFNPEALKKLQEDKLKLQAEYKEVSDNETRIFYTETEDGKGLYIPRGFYTWADDKLENNISLDQNVKIYEAELRDYQSEAIKKLLSKQVGTCVMATGLGKSRMITTICKTFAKMGKRTLVIVPSEYLVNQMASDISEFHPSVAKASSKNKPKLGMDVLVSTPITAKKYIDIYDVIVADETHHLPCDTWIETIMHSNAYNIYSFTATPKREDGLDKIIHAFSGPIEINLDVEWGIENKWLKSFDFYQTPLEAHLKTGPIKLGKNISRTSAYKKIVCNEYFLDQVCKLLVRALEKDRKVIILFRTLLASSMFAKVCKKNGLSVAYASADFKKPLNDFSEGKTNVLIATDKLVAEGVNIPLADTLFNVLQNSSDTITFQSLGRILRLGDKNKPVVCDIVALGFGEFIKSAEKRAKIYNKIADNGEHK